MAHLLLVGTGLIGGSFALAARRAGLFERVTGYDRDPAVIRRALELGIVNDSLPGLTVPLGGVDAVAIAVDPRSVADTLVTLLGAGLNAEVPTFDVASVKAPVIAALQNRLGRLPSGFVPCHPMVGAERRGPAAASADLFAGGRVFLTPVPETSDSAVQRITAWWRACGAEVSLTAADIHDARVAATSHLPHLVAFACLRRLADVWDDDLTCFAGPGLRDFSRIAASDPALWRQIFEANAERVGDELAGVIREAERFLGLIRDGRFDALQAELDVAQATRRRLFPTDGAENDD